MSFVKLQASIYGMIDSKKDRPARIMAFPDRRSSFFTCRPSLSGGSYFALLHCLGCQ